MHVTAQPKETICLWFLTFVRKIVLLLLNPSHLTVNADVNGRSLEDWTPSNWFLSTNANIPNLWKKDRPPKFGRIIPVKTEEEISELNRYNSSKWFCVLELEQWSSLISIQKIATKLWRSDFRFRRILVRNFVKLSEKRTPINGFWKWHILASYVGGFVWRIVRPKLNIVNGFIQKVENEFGINISHRCHNPFVLLDDALLTQRSSTKFRPWTKLSE